MKALTLKQPWAWAVAHAGKDVENRTWKPPASVIGQRIAIHAGKGEDAPGMFARRELFEGNWPPSIITLPRGAIVAVATVAGWVTDGNIYKTGMFAGNYLTAAPLAVKKTRMSKWFTGPYGWLLADVVALPEPIPCKGNQGLWMVPVEVDAEINRQVGK